MNEKMNGIHVSKDQWVTFGFTAGAMAATLGAEALVEKVIYPHVIMPVVNKAKGLLDKARGSKEVDD